MPWLSCGGSQEDGKQVWEEDPEVHPKPAQAWHRVAVIGGGGSGGSHLPYLKRGCVVSAPLLVRIYTGTWLTNGSSVTRRGGRSQVRRIVQSGVKQNFPNSEPTFFTSLYIQQDKTGRDQSLLWGVSTTSLSLQLVQCPLQVTTEGSKISPLTATFGGRVSYHRLSASNKTRH